MTRRRKTRVGVAVATLLLLWLVAPSGAAEPATPNNGVIELGEGDAAFWEGDFSATVPHASVCTLVVDACATYAIDVTEEAWRLRVALDRPYAAGSDFQLALFDPDGNERVTPEERLRDTIQGPNEFHSVELFAEEPAVGRWVVRVVARNVTYSGFHRMRAKLEAAPRQPRQLEPLLPNLQPIPPFELTFRNPGADAVNGCRADERVGEENPPRLCLRFSTGPMNVGDGPLDLRYAEVGQLEGDIFQRIHWSDGRVEEVPGGTYHYHLEHHHYHHDSIGGNQLLRVEEDGSLTQVSSTPKNGYCMGDYLIAEWDKFEADRTRTFADQIAGCGLTGPLGANLGLTKGWGDVYAWYTLGNYVEFDGAGDGEYVIRMASNDDGRIVETDYSDNLSYVHFRVTGTDIEVFERGIGTGPRDPHKMIVDDTRLPTVP